MAEKRKGDRPGKKKKKKTADDAGPATSTESANAAGGALQRVPLKRIDWRISVLLLLICCGIYLPVMGSYGMFDPWETHYTEVARQFMERDDWLYTHWHNGTGPEGRAENHFFSKPVGSFWMSGLSLKLLGQADKITLRGARKIGGGHDPGEYITTGSVEWAVRLPFFLCGLFAIFCVFVMCSRLFNTRTGLLAAVIMATAPMFFMITRQAMTDMPYVGMMTGGLALFALAVFGAPEVLPRRSVRIGRFELSWPHAPSYYLFLGGFVLLMTLQLRAIVLGLLTVPLPLRLGGRPISAALVMALYVITSLIFIWMSRKTRSKNEIYLYIFYIATAIAGLAKGLVGALQPGMVILLYLVTSREWRMLAHVALGRGLLLALTVFAPWYHGMLLRFGRGFWNELFGTEQFRRLTIGEQKQAKGTWEYYLQQIGYALFPWIAFLPAALVRLFGIPGKDRTARDRARLFVFVWFLGTLALFTLTLTKYHHYILPTIPPAAILIAFFLDDMLERRTPWATPALAIGLGILGVVGIDLVKQPAQWVWMYTYLYTSNWARGVPESTPILVYALVFGGVLLFTLLPKLRKPAIWALAIAAIGGGGYVLNWYQLGVAPHWSQKYVLKTYYKLRKGPEEELVAWQFNWRGETWYTAAQVVVHKSLKNRAIQEWLRKRSGRRFFFITERSRYSSLRHMLPTKRGKKTLRIVDDNNVHYILAEAYI